MHQTFKDTNMLKLQEIPEGATKRLEGMLK
jgi:hypothetical protein